MVKKINHAYGLEQALVKVPHLPIERDSAPTATDKDFSLGQPYIYKVDSDNSTIYFFGGLDSSGDAIWVIGGPGASDVDTINALAPVLGDILIDGGTNITDVNAGHTVTLNLNDAIVLATSVTAPFYTAAAADVVLVAGGANDVVLRLGDNAGATSFRVQDSDSADVYTIDSDGAHTTFSGLTVAGAFTQTAGVVNISMDNAANAVNIAGGTTLRAVTILAGAAAHTLAIGSASAGAMTIDTAAGISIDSATASNFTVTGVADLTIGSTGGGVDLTSGEAAVTAISLDATDAAGGVTIAAGTGGLNFGNQADCTTIGLGDIAPTATRTITIGGGTVITAATTDTVDIGPDGATTNANSIKTVNINTGGVTLGEVLTHIATGAITSGTHTVNIQSGAVTAGTVATNISTGTGTKNVNVGNADALTTIAINGPTAINTSVNAAFSACVGTSTGTVTLGNIATSTAMSLESSTTFDLDTAGAISLNSTGAVINIGNDANAFAINVGTGAAQRDITIGNVTGTSGTDINVGTGNFNLEGATTSTYAISNVGVNTGQVDIAGGTGSRTVNIAGGGTGIKTVNIAAGASADVVTIGDATGAGSLALVAGTGGITVTGTVQNIVSNFIARNGDDITFTQSPMTGSALDTGVAATGATGDVNLLSFQEGMMMEQFVLGAGQTIIKPVMTATGLLISGDEVTTEGFEYNFGAARANSRHSFTIGTSAAFFLEFSFRADDISGLEPCYLGFRKTQANQATGAILTYTDFVGYGLNDGIAPGDCVIETQLNTGGSVSTDTNDAWADTATHTLRINVSAAGAVTFLFDGGAPTATQAYTFDAGDVVHPFFRHEFNAALPDAIEWLGMQCGYQA